MVDDQTQGFRVQHREWEAPKKNAKVESSLSTALGSASTNGQVTRWAGDRFWGLFSYVVTLKKQDDERVVTYSSYKAKRTAKIELLGLVIGLLLMAVVGVASGVFEWATVDRVLVFSTAAIRSPTTVLLIILFAIALFGTLAVINRGPHPHFPTTNLESRYTTYAISHFVYVGLLVVILGTSIGTWMNYPAVGAIVFGLLYGITVYATNRVPAFRDETNYLQLEAGQPLFSGTNLHFNVAVVALLPALLGLLSLFITTLAAPIVPSSIDRPLWMVAWFVAVPVGLCLLYGYWCQQIGRRLERTSAQSSQSTAIRGLVALVFCLINIVVMILTLVLLQAAVGPLLYRVVQTDLRYTPTGLSIITGLIVVLFSIALCGAVIYQRLFDRETDAEQLRSRAVRYGNTLVLFGVFSLLSFFVTHVFVGAILFGDGGLFDPSARTIRGSLETQVVFTELTAGVPLPVDVRVLPMTILQVLPVVVLGLSWGARIDHELRERLAIARSGFKLDTEDRPVPEDVPVVVTDIGVTTGVQIGLRGSYVLLEQSVIDRLTEDQLDALLAHEAYHVQNRDTIIDFAGLVASFVLGSDSVLHLFYDLAESEYQADQHAINRVGGIELARAIEHQGTDSSSLPGPGTSTVGFADTVTERLRGATDTEADPTGRLKQIVTTGLYLLLAPGLVLFGGSVTSHAHMDPETRKRLCCLSDELYDWVWLNTDTVHVTLPVEQEVVHPVPVSEIYETWRAKGAREEQIKAALTALCDAGKLHRVRNDHVVLSEMWQ